MKRVLFKEYLAVFLTLFLLACSPQYDWRIVRNESLGFTAQFPAKPQQLERDIPYYFGGQSYLLKQYLQFAGVDEEIYSVMTIMVPPSLISETNPILEQLKSKLLLEKEGQVAGPPQFDQITNKVSPKLNQGNIGAYKTDYYLRVNKPKGDARLMRTQWIMRPQSNGSVFIYQLSLIKPIPALAKTDTLLVIDKVFDNDNDNTFFDEFRAL
jgi:hypothetical protein